MKLIRLVLSLVLVSLIAAPLNWTRAQDDWTRVGTGVDYREYSLPDPNAIFVARMERTNPAVTIEAGLADGRIVDAWEPVSKMAERYDESLITWGNAWGNRANVIAAINGSYIDEETMQALSGMVISGWYAKRYDSLTGPTGFAWTRDRDAFLGKCVNTVPYKQLITFTDAETMEIDGVNVPRGDNALVIYTPQYDSNTHTAAGGVEVVVEMGAPAGIKPLPSGAPGVVTAILNGSGSTYIPFDAVVLSAEGSAADSLLNNVQVGDTILISQEIQHLDDDCINTYPQSWTNTYAAVSGVYQFLQNGVIINFDGDDGATMVHPRTAILFNEFYIFFVVVDGRNPDYSIGMTIEELAYFSRDVLGATWGIAQDGGGSSTMVINGKIMNIPSEPCERIYMPFVMREVAGTPYPLAGTAPQSPVQPVRYPCMREVANTMMMVEVLQAEASTTYEPAMLVGTLTDIELRLGPGWNYASYTTIPAGSQGSILATTKGLEGVYAKGSYWWKVNFSGVEGWAPEEQLIDGPVKKLVRVIPR